MSFIKYWFTTYFRKSKGLHTKLSFNPYLNTNHLNKNFSPKPTLINNARGQGLIEYLIIVGIMAVASLGAVRLLNKTVNSNFTNIIYALQGKQKKVRIEAPKESLYKKKDFNTFMNGAASKEK